MSMSTRCPHCSTSFKVFPDQLKAHRGVVRCGACAKTFNAFDSLSTLEEAADTPAEPIQKGEPATEKIFGEIHDNIPAADEEPFLVEEKKRAWPWVAGVFLLVILLAGQGIYYYRMQISIMAPGLKPLLQSSCDILGCAIPLPKNSALVGIESSTLLADPVRPDVIILSASIRNSAPYAQAYPSLELTLTDLQDAPMARKVFKPAEYVPKGTAEDKGMAPNSLVSIHLNLEAKQMQASGYRLYLFYP